MVKKFVQGPTSKDMSQRKVNHRKLELVTKIEDTSNLALRLT